MVFQISNKKCSNCAGPTNVHSPKVDSQFSERPTERHLFWAQVHTDPLSLDDTALYCEACVTFLHRREALLCTEQSLPLHMDDLHIHLENSGFCGLFPFHRMYFCNFSRFLTRKQSLFSKQRLICKETAFWRQIWAPVPSRQRIPLNFSETGNQAFCLPEYLPTGLYNWWAESRMGCKLELTTMLTAYLTPYTTLGHQGKGTKYPR